MNIGIINNRLLILAIAVPFLLTSCCQEKYYAINPHHNCQMDSARKHGVRSYAIAHKLNGDNYKKMEYELDSDEKANSQIEGIFTVYKIYHGKHVSEVLVTPDSNHFYELYVPYDRKIGRGERIKEGGQYRLTLMPFISHPDGVPMAETTRYVIMNGFLIWPYPIYHGQVYSTNDLDGLFVRPGEK